MYFDDSEMFSFSFVLIFPYTILCKWKKKCFCNLTFSVQWRTGSVHVCDEQNQDGDRFDTPWRKVNLPKRLKPAGFYYLRWAESAKDGLDRTAASLSLVFSSPRRTNWLRSGLKTWASFKISRGGHSGVTKWASFREFLTPVVENTCVPGLLGQKKCTYFPNFCA